MGGHSPEDRVLHPIQEGFCHSNLFLGRMKANTKWLGMCVWRGDGGNNEKIWGDTGGVDTDGRNTRTQVVRAPRRFLGRETGDCRKRGLVGRAQPGPVASKESGRCCARPRASGGTPGVEEGLQAGGVTGWCLLGVLRSRGRPCTHNAGKVSVFRVRHGGGEASLGDQDLGGAGAVFG